MLLVTGAAGFIGFHLCKHLLDNGYKIVGIDNLNEYYDLNLKKARLKILKQKSDFIFHKIDLCNYRKLKELFKTYSFDCVCNLAAQAGVRYSLTHPFVYQKSNLEGFLNILELSKDFKIKHFVYASSSSVYGNNKKLPFSEKDRVDKPISLYASTKRANELIAYTYSHLFGLNCSGLRFFTVYGPWGRPDMALFLFTKAISENRPIQLFNKGKMIRNFTYIDDIVDGVRRIIENPRRYEIYNIGNNRAETLLDFVKEIEKCLGKKASRKYLPMQPGDVRTTIADISKIGKLGFKPKTNIAEGVKKFIDWYKEYYNI